MHDVGRSETLKHWIDALMCALVASSFAKTHMLSDCQSEKHMLMLSDEVHARYFKSPKSVSNLKCFPSSRIDEQSYVRARCWKLPKNAQAFHVSKEKVNVQVMSMRVLSTLEQTTHILYDSLQTRRFPQRSRCLLLSYHVCNPSLSPTSYTYINSSVDFSSFSPICPAYKHYCKRKPKTLMCWRVVSRCQMSANAFGCLLRNCKLWNCAQLSSDTMYVSTALRLWNLHVRLPMFRYFSVFSAAVERSSMAVYGTINIHKSEA